MNDSSKPDESGQQDWLPGTLAGNTQTGSTAIRGDMPQSSEFYLRCNQKELAAAHTLNRTDTEIPITKTGSQQTRQRKE